MDNLGFSGAASNPYLDKSVNDAQAATTRAYNNTTAPAYTSAMVRSGSFGNSGLEQAQGDATRQYQDTLGKQANDMYSGNYQFGQNQAQQQNQFGRSLDQNQNQFGRNLDQNNSQFGRSLDQGMNQFNLNFDRGTYNDSFNQGQQQYQNGINLIGMQNQSNQQNLGFGTQVQNAPMNYYQGFANTANGIGNGFSTLSQTSSAPGSRLMGALGGAQIGSQYGEQIGNWMQSQQTPTYTGSRGYDPYQASMSGGFEPQGL